MKITEQDIGRKCSINGTLGGLTFYDSLGIIRSILETVPRIGIELIQKKYELKGVTVMGFYVPEDKITIIDELPKQELPDFKLNDRVEDKVTKAHGTILLLGLTL